MNGVRELAQMDERVAEVALQLVEGLIAAVVTTAQLFARQGELRGQDHQVLLEAVVQVSLDSLPLGVLGAHDPGPGRRQLGSLIPDHLEPGRQLRAQVQVVHGGGGLAGQVDKQATVFVEQRAVSAWSALDRAERFAGVRERHDQRWRRRVRGVRRRPSRRAGGRQAVSRDRAAPWSSCSSRD